MDELTEKRAILLSTRLRFAPEAQSIREAAIDRMVERALLLVDDPSIESTDVVYERAEGP